MLIDYRALNNISLPIEFYFPTIKEAFMKIKGNKFFTKFDLEKGFYQLEIEENHKHKTAFTCPFGKFQFNRVPFGLKNAPKFFNAIIARILYDFENVIVFIDDILIFDKDLQSHLNSLEKIIILLAEHNVVINHDKSEIMVNKIHYLGYEISSDSYKPDLSRLKDFSTWQTPRTRTQLQKLLGTIIWYAEFIPNLHTKTDHLYDKLKNNNTKIIITDDEMTPVHEIYNQIKYNSLNFLPGANNDFFIFTDASDNGMGAVLTQKGGVIAFHSKKFSEVERRYSTTEKEAYSIFIAISKWVDMIGGSKIIIHTDNRNNLNKNIDITKRCDRWKSIYAHLNIEYKFIEGAKNLVADDLSRRKFNLISTDDNIDPAFTHFLTQFHIIHGHPGMTKTIQTLLLSMELNPQQKKYICDIIKKCIFCQTNKRNKFKYAKIQGGIKTQRPLLDISTDVFGPIQLLNYKSDFEGDTAYIITFTDRCTNYTKIYFTQSITSQDIIYAFESCWLKNFNLPQTLLTDNASYYISDQFTEYLSNMGILHLRSSIYNPTGNSLSERINSDIVVILKIYKGWSLNLFTLVIENRINNTYNSFLRSTPTKIITEGLEKIFELKDNSISKNALRSIIFTIKVMKFLL